MDYPYNLVQAQTSNEDTRVNVYMQVQSEYVTVDETALAHIIQQWLATNVPNVVSTMAERHEQVFPVTALPPLTP